MPDDMVQPISNIYISHRLRLHYLDWGNPHAPALLLVHGGRDHAHSWDWVARALQPDWHVIALDLRGHGDSAWSPDGAYLVPYFVYDIAQLIHQLGLTDLSIVAHSFGGTLALLYAGLYPEKISKLVVIEGIDAAPPPFPEMMRRPADERYRSWIEQQRGFSNYPPKRYASIEEALARMRLENTHLNETQARHLTMHGVSRNEDGSYSWKFDHYIRAVPPAEMDIAEQRALWRRITCPVLLMNGRKSWVPDPVTTGDVQRFQAARAVAFDDAGHWLHHDQFERFISELKEFL